MPPYRRYVKKTAYKRPVVSKGVKSYVKKSLNTNIETKQFQKHDAFQSQDNTTATFQDLSLITDADPDGARIGGEVMGKKMTISLQLKNNVAGSPSMIVRCIIFRWNNDTQLAAPALNYILAASQAVANRCTAPPAVYKPGDATILMDRVLTFGSVATAIGPDVHVLRKTIKLNRKIYFDDQAGVTAGKGHIFIMFLSDAAVASGFYPYIAYNSIIHYQDA